MNMDYSGKYVAVTGGTGALGAAVVKRLVEAGAHCYVPSRGPAAAKAISNDVTVLPGIELTDEDQVMKFYAGLPPLWASIHTAGGFAMSPITDTKLSDFRSMMDMNAATCFLCCREAVKRIRAAGAGGRIVNVAARPAMVPVGGMVAYAASKAAVRSITESLAEELAGERIWVNAVVPSIMDTPANRSAMPTADFAKWAKLEEAAETIAFLASPQNAVTRGGMVPVYGPS